MRWSGLTKSFCSTSCTSLHSYKRPQYYIPYYNPHHQRKVLTPSSSSLLSLRTMTVTAKQQLICFNRQKDALDYIISEVKRYPNQEEIKRCGDLACQHDSLLNTLHSSKIITFTPFQVDTAKSNTKSKPGDKATKSKGKRRMSFMNMADTTSNKLQYFIALNDSIFFPEGGGQPCDKGSITVSNSSSLEFSAASEISSLDLSITNVQNVKGICVLTAQLPKDKGKTSTQEHVLGELMKTDAVVIQEIDWDMRFDHMTQHSAQHLISAIALNEPFQIQTHSFSLSKTSLTSYIDFKIDPDVKILRYFAVMTRMERIANQHIVDNLSMTVKYIDPNDENDMLFLKNNVRSRLLPKDDDPTTTNGGSPPRKIRLIEIENGIDVNTCCGIHVPNLGQLQMIKFIRMEKFKPTILRLHYASSKRLFQLINECNTRETNATTLLSCTKHEYLDRVTLLLEDKKEKEKVISQTNAKLCSLLAKDIVRHLGERDNISVIDLEASYEMSFLSSLATTVIGNIGSRDGMLLLLVEGNEISNEGSFLLVGDVDLVSKASGEIKVALGGRGGGAHGKFQGKGTSIRSGLGNAKKILKRVKSKNCK